MTRVPIAAGSAAVATVSCSNRRGRGNVRHVNSHRIQQQSLLVKEWPGPRTNEMAQAASQGITLSHHAFPEGSDLSKILAQMHGE